MSLNLIRRLVKGSRLTAAEYDSNLDKLEAAVLALPTQEQINTLVTAFIYEQAQPATMWIINHNLGYRPAVELLDTGGQEIDGDISHPTVNQTVIMLQPATAGIARLT